MYRDGFFSVGAFLGASLVAFGAAAAEPSARVADIAGVALVNRGAEYVTATPGMALGEGDRVMAMEGGSVTLRFADGCVYKVNDNTVLTVASATSCSTGQMASSQVGPYLAAAAPAVPAVTGGLIAAGVIGAVVIIAAASDTGSDSRQSVSP